MGAAFALVGAAVTVAVLYPGDDPTVARSDAAGVDGLTSGAWRPFVVSGAPHLLTLSLSWTATGPAPNATADVNVSLYAAYPCPPATEPCVQTPTLVSWTLKSTGGWSGPGTDEPEYLLFVSAPDMRNVSVNFTATLVEQYRLQMQPLPSVPLLVTILGGGLLAGVGAVAVYLGLFLPAGVYGPAAGEDLDPDERLDPAREAEAEAEPDWKG